MKNVINSVIISLIFGLLAGSSSGYYYGTTKSAVVSDLKSQVSNLQSTLSEQIKKTLQERAKFLIANEGIDLVDLFQDPLNKNAFYFITHDSSIDSIHRFIITDEIISRKTITFEDYQNQSIGSIHFQNLNTDLSKITGLGIVDHKLIFGIVPEDYSPGLGFSLCAVLKDDPKFKTFDKFIDLTIENPKPQKITSEIGVQFIKDCLEIIL